MDKKNTEEIITTKNHPNLLSERLFGLLQRKAYCDTDIVVNDQT